MDEYVGYWWRPDRPRKKIAGTLKVARDGAARLELFGSLNPAPRRPEELLAAREESHSRLYGHAHGPDGSMTRLTLVDCRYAASKRGGGALPALTLRPSVTLMGQVFVPDDRFLGCVVEFAGLSEWAGRSRPTFEFDQRPYPRRIDIAYSAGDDVTAQLGFGRVTLRHGPVFGIGESVQLEDVVTFIVEPGGPMTWDELVGGPVRTLGNFVSLALDIGAAITNLRLHVPDKSQPSGFTSVAARFEQRGEFPADDVEYPWNRMLFRRVDARDDRLPDMLRAWFELRANLPDVIDLHLAARYRPQIFGESRFLFAAQSYEALHRESSAFVSESSPRAVFEAERKAILDQLETKADRNRVKAALGSNRKGAKTVFGEVFAEVSDVAHELHIDRRVLQRRAGDTRNEIVHLLRRSEDSAGLYKLAATLHLLMGAYLMRGIGFSPAEVCDCMRRYAPARMIADWWREGF